MSKTQIFDAENEGRKQVHFHRDLVQHLLVIEEEMASWKRRNVMAQYLGEVTNEEYRAVVSTLIHFQFRLKEILR